MSLPLLRYTAELYPKTDFSRVGIIACQHLLGTTLDLFAELFLKGLKPENVYLLGKCYSTHLGTLKKFKKLGVHVSELSTEFDPSVPYDQQFKAYTTSFTASALAELATEELDDVLLLDDGGFVIEYANRFVKDTSHLEAVEQTSSGYVKVKNINLRFPVVNVARSQAKLAIESSLIAKRVIEKLLEGTKVTADSRILVMGQGTIGREIKTQIGKICHVSGCDSKAERCDFQGKYLDRLSSFDIVVGSTGQAVLSFEDCQRLKKGAVLASASSSDREFPASLFRAESKSSDCHVDLERNGVKLLNGGFPINFDGKQHSLPPNEAQLTRSLLFMGLCEALEHRGKKGILELSNQQALVTEEFKKYVH